MKLLQVTYNSQRDNKKEPYTSCFPTSVSMVLSYQLREHGLQFPHDYDPSNDFADWVTQKVEYKYRDPEVTAWAKGQWFYRKWVASRTVWITYEWFFKTYSPRYGWNLECINLHHKGDYDKIKKEINNNNPVVIGGLFPRLLSGRGGHIGVVSGYTDEGLIICDPYGQARKKYGKAEFKKVSEARDGSHHLVPWNYCDKWYKSTGKINIMLIRPK